MEEGQVGQETSSATLMDRENAQYYPLYERAMQEPGPSYFNPFENLAKPEASCKKSTNGLAILEQIIDQALDNMGGKVVPTDENPDGNTEHYESAHLAEVNVEAVECSASNSESNKEKCDASTSAGITSKDALVERRTFFSEINEALPLTEAITVSQTDIDMGLGHPNLEISQDAFSIFQDLNRLIQSDHSSDVGITSKDTPVEGQHNFTFSNGFQLDQALNKPTASGPSIPKRFKNANHHIDCVASTSRIRSSTGDPPSEDPSANLPRPQIRLRDMSTLMETLQKDSVTTTSSQKNSTKGAQKSPTKENGNTATTSSASPQPYKPKNLSVVITPQEEYRARAALNCNNSVTNNIGTHKKNCKQCMKTIAPLEEHLSWSIFNFCTYACLFSYQKEHSMCKCGAQIATGNLGKFCIHLGDGIEIFCGPKCAAVYRGNLKICRWCCRKMPEINQVQPKQLCTDCRNKSKSRNQNGTCSVCNQRHTTIEFEYKKQTKFFCNKVCFCLYKNNFNITTDNCSKCKKYTCLETLQKYALCYQSQIFGFCSKACRSMYVTVTRKMVSCDWCNFRKYNYDMIQLHVSNTATILLCSLNCLDSQMQIQAKNGQLLKCTLCRKIMKSPMYFLKVTGTLQIFCSYTCMTSFKRSMTSTQKPQHARASSAAVSPSSTTTIIRQQENILGRLKPKRNMSTMCTINTSNAEIQTKPSVAHAKVQTAPIPPNIVPVPVPLYIPVPLWMYSLPLPVPYPFPLPIPVPVFIPTTRSCYEDIVGDLRALPANPEEAEMLLMANMIAGEDAAELPAKVETPMENTTVPIACDLDIAETVEVETTSAPRKRKRKQQGGSKKRRRELQPEPEESAIKVLPNSNTCLKFEYSVKAWNQWISNRSKIHEDPNPTMDLLNLSPFELNIQLCKFIQEVRKPTGELYSPDVIYYLCSGVQLYLSVNERVDNLFCDVYYAQFVTILDEIAKTFSCLDSFVVTRVEEEHLWESKQLGAHSPQTLLNTLIYFNTKHFNLRTVEDHVNIGFSHIMKHWKTKKGASGSPRNVLLRLYSTQATRSNPGRKVFEQHENLENAMRCPVKLYEFYMSKCPETVKTRMDVFYLQPERSCIAESPVWFSVLPLQDDIISKTLNRVKMVKEINVAFMGMT